MNEEGETDMVLDSGRPSNVAVAGIAATGMAADELSFVFNGFLLKRREIQQIVNNSPSPIMTVGGPSVADPDVVHLFDSPEAFDNWARTTRYAEKFVQINEIIHRARRHTTKPLRQPSVRLVANSPLELSAMGQRQNAIPDDVDARGALTLLYEEVQYQGQCFTLGPAAISDLGDIDLFKQVRSARISGVCLLTDEVSFGGTRLYLVGTPTLNIADLRAWGFGSGAASAINL